MRSPKFLTLLSTPTTLSGGPRQTLGTLTNTRPLGRLLERSHHRRLHKLRSRGCLKLWRVRSLLRSPWYPVDASPGSFGCLPPLQMQHAVRGVARPYPVGTSTPQETPSFAWRTNAGAHLLPEAGARQLGSDKARSVQARFPIAPVYTGRAALTASGSAPLIDLHGVTMKRRFPFRQFHRYPPVYGLRVHWVPLFPSSQRLGAFAISPYPGVYGLPVLRLLCPIRLSLRALAFRWGLSCLLPTRLDIPQEVSRVPHGRLKRNAGGGVFLSLPLPLFAAPQSLHRG